MCADEKPCIQGIGDVKQFWTFLCAIAAPIVVLLSGTGAALALEYSVTVSGADGDLLRAIEGAHEVLGFVIEKARFWDRFATEPLNERQISMLNKLLDGIEGKLTTSKWAKMAKCSQDTAYRDILDLVRRGALQQDAGGGRSTSFSLAWRVPDSR